MTGNVQVRRAWRSLLFVPGNQARLLAGAAKRGADAVVVDLEDSIPEAQKSTARDGFAAALARNEWHDCDLLVRINNLPDRCEADVMAAIQAGANGIVVPKAEDADSLNRFSDLLGKAEKGCGRASGATVLVPLVETPGGLFRLREIAAAARVAAIAFGDEDLALALGCSVESSTLATYKHMLIVAAAEAGCQPLGLGASITQFGDLQVFRAGAMAARSWGMTGAFCIHPAQAAVLNEVFAPSEEEVEHARNIIRHFETGNRNGHGAVAYNGTMIDWPVAARAFRILELAGSTQSRALCGTGR